MMFRSIRKNTSAFTQNLIEDVKSAAQLASIPMEQPASSQGGRGRGYLGWSRGPGMRFHGGFNQFRGRGRGQYNELPAVTYPRQIPSDCIQHQDM